MSKRIKHTIEKEAPKEYRVPENVPKIPKYSTIVADPPWTKNQASGNEKNYGGAINHYTLMSLDLIKNLPIADLAADNAHLYLWVTDGNIDEGLEVIKAWGFRYITTITWNKPRLGVGNYWRNSTEHILFAVKGKLPPLSRNVMNWFISYPTIHSEKPREFIPMLEKVSPGPYLELFCRNRPASNKKWYCWGNETEGGADIFIPGYPVPKYSFENDSSDTEASSTENNSDSEDSVNNTDQREEA